MPHVKFTGKEHSRELPMKLLHGTLFTRISSENNFLEIPVNLIFEHFQSHIKHTEQVSFSELKFI